jgi:2-polyprenyl-3-methyl-5-hydroxy-6-metoxy-1,4-benzoquinol methylase
MNDDFGTRRGDKAERRRRTTRRLTKHAARALGDAALSVRPEATDAEHDSQPVAQPDLQPEAAAAVDELPFDSESLDGPPPAPENEAPVPWSAEESPLMAALSAAADASTAGWDADDEPDTATHTSSAPPALVNDVASGLVAVAGGAAAGDLQSPQPSAAAAATEDTASSDPSSEFGLDEPTEPGAPVLPAVTRETEAGTAAAAPPTQDAWGEIAESDRPAAAGTRDEEPEQEVKTKPKIRLPEGAARRPSPRTSVAAPPAAPDVALGRSGASPMPPTPASRPGSPLPPVPIPASRASRNPPAPTGEGIIRASQPPRPLPGFGRPDLDSDVPTRPRIPLTHDMALAAGRVSALGVPRIAASDADATRPRILVAEGESGEAAPAVVVTRSRVISDRPEISYGAAADSGESEATRAAHVAEAADVYTQEPLDESEDVVMGDDLDAAPDEPPPRPSRRSRPDSEEFETLDLEESEEQPARLEIPGGNGELRGTEIGARVSRTPPPPPAQPNKRGPSPAAQQRAAPPPPPPGAAKKPPPAHKDKDKEKDKDKTRTKRRAWWEVLFSDDYVRTLPRPSQALVAKQVGFMESSLGISRGDAVLDVGCGLGQHALEFARRGYLVVALDLALSMITRAAEEAQQHNLRINFLHKDIRDIGFEGTFDAILCVGTTFGFFDDEQNRGVLQRLAHALKPGGRLLLEVVNRDYVIGSQPNLVWFEGDGCVVMEESDFNFYSSRLNVKRTMMREDGRQTESEYSVRLYSVHELGQLLKQAGFGIKEVSGQEATRGLFFGSQSSRIIMLAERRTPGRSRPDSSPPASE